MMDRQKNLIIKNFWYNIFLEIQSVKRLKFGCFHFYIFASEWCVSNEIYFYSDFVQ